MFIKEFKFGQYIMGSVCGKKTTASIYIPFLTVQNIALLKQQWPPLKLFKLRKIFQTNSHSHQNTRQRCLTPFAFFKLLSQFDLQKFKSYSEDNKKKLFELFDRESVGYLSWQNFFIGLTLCYFGPEEVLSVILFGMFDSKVRRQLSRQQLLDLLSKNSKYLKESEDQTEMVEDKSTIAEAIMEAKTVIRLQEWMSKSPAYIDYQQFRKLFNIFEEEEIEKDMALNFNQINTLYNQDKNEYIAYVVNYKWFQSWKTYIYKEYNIQVNGFSQNLTYIKTNKTIKSTKTKKTLRSFKSAKSLRSSKSMNSVKNNKKIIEEPRLKEIANPFKELEDSHNTQYNLIYSSIGDKPLQINNNLLEGQFSEMLKPELVQNVNYVLVSQEVWRRLKLIYGAYPQFRRTGKQTIQIYPKLFKIYTKFHGGRIDYEQQKVCQFSKFMQMDLLISKALQLTIQDLNRYLVFCKSCSNYKWQQITDLSLTASEVNSEQMVFMAVVPAHQSAQFRQINCKVAQTIKEIHIGDQFLYCVPIQKTAVRAVFMGRNKYKMIIHFKGLSYVYDICIDRDQFYLRSNLNKRAIEASRNKVCSEELRLIGMPNSKGLGFINSFLLSLFSNQIFTSQIQHFYCQEPSSLLQYLATILHLLNNSYRMNTIIISDMIRYFMPEYTDFEFTMYKLFVEEFINKINKCLEQQGVMVNPVEDYLIESEIVVVCENCHKSSSERNTFFSLMLTIPEQQLKYYQIIYVPFAYSLKSVEIKRYGFSLAKASTMKDYRQMFEKVAGLKDTVYVITEIEGDVIIKNYLNARNDATLQDLLLREDDRIYAFQLCFKIHEFVNDHYSTQPVLKFSSLKVGQLVDFQKDGSSTSINHPRTRGELERIADKSNQAVMAFGKIVSIQTESYTHRLILKVEYHQNRQTICKKINPQNVNMAIFPTRSYMYADHYHIRVLQRFHNQVSNQMQIFSMPFVILITSWMRLKELQLLIYQQIRELIHQDYKFNLNQEGYFQEGLSKINKKEKMKKFKQYLYGGKVPYEIKFTDLNGRCGVCYKIQKSRLLEEEEEFCCSGCSLQADLPIFWQIRPYQTRVCVDWRSPEASVKPCIYQDNSFTATRSARKNCVFDLSDCINYRLNNGEIDQCCCMLTQIDNKKYAERILNNPQRVIIMFDRLIEEDQNYKHITRKYIHFQMEQLPLNGSLYQLVAATSIEGSQIDATYLTYIRNNNRWLQYNAEHVRIVKKAYVQKICPLILHYRKTGNIFNQKLNYKQ